MTDNTTLKLEILNQNGLHMRPAAKLFQTLKGFDYALIYDGDTIKNPGILKYMTLGAVKGSKLAFSHSFQGKEAEKFYNTLVKMEIPGEGRIFAAPSDLEDTVVELNESELH